MYQNRVKKGCVNCVEIVKTFYQAFLRINYILNWLLFIAGTVIMPSGFMISESLLLAVFTLVMGMTFLIVNARSSSSLGVPPRFEQANGRFAPPDGAPPGFETGERPAFPGEGQEFRGERGCGGWLVEALRNMAIIGIIVVLIVVPKSWIQKRKRTA
jgi:hypothetical protein